MSGSLFRFATLHFKGFQKHYTITLILFLLKMGHIYLQRRNLDTPSSTGRQHLLLCNNSFEGGAIHSGVRHFSANADTLAEIGLIQQAQRFFAQDV